MSKLMRTCRGSHDLNWALDRLRSTGRGKFVGQFAYFHTDLIRLLPDVESLIRGVSVRFLHQPLDYNVVKIGPRSLLSFLLYEDFTEPFPALLVSLACNIGTGASKWTDYRRRSNPPILHRKELLLPSHDPRALRGETLTRDLEALGAFTDPHRIGTREHWRTTLERLGLTLKQGNLVSASCPSR